MGTTIRINPLAAADLQEIKKHTEEESMEAAIKVVKGSIEKIENLSDFPEMGARLKHRIGVNVKHRYITCGQYLIFYIYEHNTVSVQRILHGKRDYISLLN